MGMGPREYRAALLRLQRAQRAALNQLIAQTEAQLRAEWERVPSQMRPQFQALLDGYAMDLAALRSSLDDPSARLPMTWITNNQYRVTQLDRSINNAVNTYAENAAAMVTHAQQTGAPLGAQDAIALTRAALSPVQAAALAMHLGVTRPNPNAIAALIGRASNGQPLATLFQGFGAEATAGARRALLTGIALGHHPQAIARDLANALGVSRSRALTIARTEILGAYRDAALENYQANSDVVAGWIWSAEGANSCAACVFMDGSYHSLDEGMDSHICCRCAMLPATRTWSDILGPLGVDDETIDSIPETSMGRPGAYQSGEDWFAEQSDATQRDILGSQAAFDAFKQGDVTLGDFVGTRHDPQWGSSVYQKSWKQVQAALKG